MPKVSVLLTCFNHLRFLPDCLEGVRRQTHSDVEIIALDDGSTDGTREWLRENASDAELVFHEKNLGTYSSLNVGLERASGEFVAILNDDDLWAPEKLEKQLALFERMPELGLVHTGGAFIDAEGRRVEGKPFGFEFPKEMNGGAILSLIYANVIIASAVLARRECFQKVGGFDPDYFGSGDWHMWLRIAEEYSIGFAPDELTFYRVHEGNASHSQQRIWKDDERQREWIKTRYGDYRERALDPRALRRAMAHNEACLGTVRRLTGDRGRARQALQESIRLAPTRVKSYLQWLATFLPRAAFRKQN